MTCIVGLKHNGKIYMGGDSAGVAGLRLTTRADEKVFINHNMIMGFTSSFRMGQLLRYSFDPPELQENQEVYEYMVTTFIDSVRDCLKEGGYASKENEVEEGGVFLVGFRGCLFKIESDYQVGESITPYSAIGCGEEIALGAMYAAVDLSPKDRIKVALKAANEFSAGVTPPFRILVL